MIEKLDYWKAYKMCKKVSVLNYKLNDLVEALNDCVMFSKVLAIGVGFVFQVFGAFELYHLFVINKSVSIKLSLFSWLVCFVAVIIAFFACADALSNAVG